MTVSPAHAVLFTPLNWDPDLLPPLEMDGYLTGTLVTPELEVTDWVADLWTAIPPVIDQARMKQSLAAVLTRRKAIEADLQKGWPAYQPSFCERGKKADHDTIRKWMKGFYRAMKLHADYWSDLADDDRTETFVALLFGFIETDEPIEERDDADAIRDQHAELLPRAILAMRKLALLRDGNATALRSLQARKVGRNDPCPCGSGKKYKRCCAA
jgi:uncharacterized protein